MKEKISLKKLRKLSLKYPTRYIVFGGCVIYNGCLYKDQQALVNYFFKCNTNFRDIENIKELEV
ncbi:MAG: hypothetical protein GKR88_19060 [Flavobacteriaceae bacterium]|nr:MAG: hypothetical protein GKR88_08680 [Flavobacteriaceae bacterium]QMU66152.1 MAG: hypothetical protein GKR88_18990 [Flavobacteriaceae bacterium]QMU66165.1 MAG: hypothetical protein GKR88_19060 [Flavobacteriaceae bacterium]